MAAKPTSDWYLKEWLGTLDATVTWLEGETGWTHRIASQLVNRRTRWNRDHLALAAKVLRIAPYELLLHPEDAMHIRRLRSAVEVEARLRAAEDRGDYAPPTGESVERLVPRRRRV
jgi:hypothetical protein